MKAHIATWRMGHPSVNLSASNHATHYESNVDDGEAIVVILNLIPGRQFGLKCH